MILNRSTLNIILNIKSCHYISFKNSYHSSKTFPISGVAFPWKYLLPRTHISRPKEKALICENSGCQTIYRSQRRYLLESVTRNTYSSKKQFTRDEILSILQLKTFTEDEIFSSYNRLITASKRPQVFHTESKSFDNEHILNEKTEMDFIFDLKYGLNNLFLLDPINSSKKYDSVDDMIDHLAQELSIQKQSSQHLNKGLISQNMREFNSLVTSNSTEISFETFRNNSIAISEQLDKRLWPITISFFGTGVSIGIIIPCMPVLVNILNISSSEFGLIVGAFGVSKLIGNIPSGYIVDNYGRKSAMVCGLGFCAVGVGGIGLAMLPGFGISWWILCRLMTGLGVSAFTAGALMYLSDISTAMNKSRTNAPALAAFQAGSALGPAVGGYLLHMIGLEMTYGVVGGMISTIAVVNHLLLPETLHKVKQLASSSSSVLSVEKSQGRDTSFSIISNTLTSWYGLLRNTHIANIVMLNGAYWLTISGAQMTLLPLFMISSPLNLDPTQIGLSFAMMSAVGVVSSFRFAILADRIGKMEVTLCGSLVLALSVCAIPFTTSYGELLCILAPFSLGSTALASIPQAYITDLTTPHDRANAMSLLRMGGDCGLILGATLSGYFAQYSSLLTTMEVNGCLMFLALSLFGMRSRSQLRQRRL